MKIVWALVQRAHAETWLCCDKVKASQFLVLTLSVGNHELVIIIKVETYKRKLNKQMTKSYASHATCAHVDLTQKRPRTTTATDPPQRRSGASQSAPDTMVAPVPPQTSATLTASTRSAAARLARRAAGSSPLDLRGVDLAALAAPEAAAVLSAVTAAMPTRSAVDVVRTLPPALLWPAWAPLVRKAVGAVKHGGAQEVAVCGAVVCAGGVFCAEGEGKRVASEVVEGALGVAMRVLGEGGEESLAALALVLACMVAAPRELRSHFAVLDGLLWGGLLRNENQAVRYAAGKVVARTLVCQSEKNVPHVFVQVLSRTCAEMDAVLDLLSLFTTKPRAPKQDRGPVKAIEGLSPKELEFHFDALCHIITQLIQQPCASPIPMASSLVIRVLCGAQELRQVDPFASGSGQSTLDPDSVLAMLPAIHSCAIATLSHFVRSLHRAGTLPYASFIGRSLANSFSGQVAMLRSNAGLLAGMHERQQLYSAVHAMVPVLGSPIVECVAQLFVETLIVDFNAGLEAQATRISLAQGPLSSMQDGFRSRKRRRFRRHEQQRAHGATDHLSGPKDSGHDAHSRAWSETALSLIIETVQRGLEAAAVIFDCRGLFSSATCDALNRLELVLSHDVDRGSFTSATILALRAAAVGGGSNRLRAEASPAFCASLRTSSAAILSNNVTFDSTRIALESRAACEALVHPRGLPVMALHTRRFVPVSKERHSQGPIDAMLIDPIHVPLGVSKTKGLSAPSETTPAIAKAENANDADMPDGNVTGAVQKSSNDVVALPTASIVETERTNAVLQPPLQADRFENLEEIAAQPHTPKHRLLGESRGKLSNEALNANADVTTSSPAGNDDVENVRPPDSKLDTDVALVGATPKTSNTKMTEDHVSSGQREILIPNEEQEQQDAELIMSLQFEASDDDKE